MSANLLERCTPEPLSIAPPEECGLGVGLYVIDRHGRPVAFAASGRPEDAQLFALAYDHALLLKTLFDGGAVFDGRRLCVGSQVFDPQPDAAGCPKIDDPPLRAALRKAVSP